MAVPNWRFLNGWKPNAAAKNETKEEIEERLREKLAGMEAIKSAMAMPNAEILKMYAANIAIDMAQIERDAFYANSAAVMPARMQDARSATAVTYPSTVSSFYPLEFAKVQNENQQKERGSGIVVGDDAKRFSNLEFD